MHADDSLDTPPVTPPPDSPDAAVGAMCAGDDGEPTSSVDTLTERAVRQLEQPPARQQWWHALALLVGSLFVFGAAGLLSNNVADLTILVLVILLHETGHYVGMRLFNYQDVRMFFIPFFGAAVSGRNTNVPGYQEAIVLLLGPLPGIALGVVVGAACLFYDNALLRAAALMLIGINVFNLLPFLPLDGGRLLQLVLFSRQRHLEAVFRVVTALLLGLISYWLGAWLLLIIAGLMLLTTTATFRISSLVQKLRREGIRTPASASGAISREESWPLVQHVREAFPQATEPKSIVTLVRSVVERLHTSPPGVIGSIVTLVVYAGSFVSALVALALLHMPTQTTVESRDAAGAVVRREEVRVLGRLQAFTELDQAGEYHGRYERYSPTSAAVVERGNYEHGTRQGDWTIYGDDGGVLSYQHYQDGQPTELPPGLEPLPAWAGESVRFPGSDFPARHK